MNSRIEKQVNRTGTWIRKFIRGTEKERPEQLRVGDEMMKLLVKRETSLSDALDALTMVMLNSLGRMYGPREEFSRFFEQVSTFLAPTERDRAVGLIPLPGAAKVQTRTVTMVGERSERTHSLAVELGEVMGKRAPKSIGDGFNALNSTMLTAIEAACGRERADEFDLLIGEFARKMQSWPVGRVQ